MKTPVSVLDIEVRHQGELTYLGLVLVAESGATWLAAVSPLLSGHLPTIRPNDRLVIRHDATTQTLLRRGRALPTMYCDPATP